MLHIHVILSLVLVARVCCQYTRPPYPTPSPEPEYPTTQTYQTPGQDYTPEPEHTPEPEYGDTPAKYENICSKSANGSTVPIKGICFEYYVCIDHIPVYRECTDNQRFDEKTGTCVDDKSCVTACPEQYKPDPKDDTKYYNGKILMFCSRGTYFDYRRCTCNAKNTKPPVRY